MNSDLKWKLGLAFLLVFVAGGMTGVFFGVHILRHHMMLGPPHSGDVPDRMREHMRRTLGLTPEQEKKIAPIVDATSAKLETIRVETAERVRTVIGIIGKTQGVNKAIRPYNNPIKKMVVKLFPVIASSPQLFIG